MMRSMCYFSYRSIERFLVRLGRSGESAQFPHKLQRRGVDFVTCRWGREVMQGFDVSAHDLLSLG